MKLHEYINTRFDSSLSWPDLEWLRAAVGRLRPNQTGEIFLTDLVAEARREGKRVAVHLTDDPEEGIGVNTRAELAMAEAAMRKRIRDQHMSAGVSFRDPDSCQVDGDVRIAADVVIERGTILEGKTSIGAGSRVGPYAVLRDTSPWLGSRRNVAITYCPSGKSASGPTSTLFACWRTNAGATMKPTAGTVTRPPIRPPSPSVAPSRKTLRGKRSISSSSITGSAAIDSGGPTDAERTNYQAKYAEGIKSIGLTPESMLQTYSVLIRVTPEKLRGF